MKIHTDIEQGTPEWHAIRAGKMTASHADAIGTAKTGLETYVYKLLSRVYSIAEEEGYLNKDMERGNELEPVARDAYEFETGHKVEQVGFVEMNEYVGCSPDGLVGEDGGVEYKCHDDVNHFKMMVNGVSEISTKYVWQMQMNMLITGRKWWDYVAYNPNFKKPLLIFRFEADPIAHAKLLAGFDKGIAMIEEIKSRVDV